MSSVLSRKLGCFLFCFSVAFRFVLYFQMIFFSILFRLSFYVSSPSFLCSSCFFRFILSACLPIYSSFLGLLVYSFNCYPCGSISFPICCFCFVLYRFVKRAFLVPRSSIVGLFEMPCLCLMLRDWPLHLCRIALLAFVHHFVIRFPCSALLFVVFLL